jgi:DNA-binding beta-propeller fold protein YncE
LRYCYLWIVVPFLLVSARVDADRLELVRYTNLWTDSPARIADAAGVTYVPDRGHLLIADSEISEYGDHTDPATGELVFKGNNVFEVSLDAVEVHGRWLATPPDPKRSEPVGIVWHPGDGHVYVTDDDQKRIFRYSFNDTHSFGLPLASALTSFDGRYTDPEGITVDPASGDLLVVSGTKKERVLRFRFDARQDTFFFVSEFSVSPHLGDPEGIAVHPVTGHVFAVASKGIAEFTGGGTFVQKFDYTFLEGTGVTFRLPGGGTFAPSSDPNDTRDLLSLYVTCRGIDNGAFPQKNSLDGGLAELRLVRDRTLSSALRVPSVYPTVQAAVDAASVGDTILISPGTYSGSIDLGSKPLALVSEHFLTGDPKAISATVLDGSGGKFVVRVGVPSVPGSGRSLIHGFTIRNADDGITSTDPFDLIHCRVTETTDGIDYEGGGGDVRYCRFDRNRDDAIDLDGATAALIEQCELVDNGDDGIEVRLHPFQGPDTLDIIVRDNLIAGNGEDGIQLIGYDVVTARRFRIEGNRITGSAKAGIGMMSGANTREDFEAAPLQEEVVVIHNTFRDNEIHVSGGARMLLANNVLVGGRLAAVKGIAGSSLIGRNIFWENNIQTGDMSQLGEAVKVTPTFADESLRLHPESPAIDAGVLEIFWDGRIWELSPHYDFRGKGPDLGALEHWVGAE